MFRLEINTDNAAFRSMQDGEGDVWYRNAEVKRILSQVISRIAMGYEEGKCIDYYGNTVGEWRFTRGSSKKY